MLILNHTNQGIILVDDEGRIKGWNKSVGIVAGFSKEKVQGDKIWKVQYRLATENVRANITEEALREFWENEVLSMKQGELLTSYGSINNASGDVEYIQDMIRAIEVDGRKYFCIFQTYFTAHKKVEDELRQKIDELATANSELELFAYSNNELKQFAYIASHQLQEPARTIMNYIKIIEEDYTLVLDDKLKKYLEIVRCAAERMSSLNNTLLDYSRLGRKSKMALVDCNQVLKTVISDLDYLICETGANIIYDKLPVLKIFEKEFYLLLLNLISNAIKFRKKGVYPEIHIGAELSGNEYRFSVNDNGIGIEQAHFEKIFDIFQRLYVDEDEYEGKGVGLAYCRKIVNMHAGKIWVESVPGEGSVFSFTIPLS
jgi:PAS domain S-box-containing protein